MPEQVEKVVIDGGKYEISWGYTAPHQPFMQFKRHGEPWEAGQRAFQHVGMVLAMAQRIAELEGKLAAADAEAGMYQADLQNKLHSTEQRLERVYDERNALVISVARLALAAGYKAGWGTDSNEQSDPEWRTVVYAQFNGVTPDELDSKRYPLQLSWHMAPNWQTAAQANLPAFDGQWDGSFLSRDPVNYVGQVPIVSHLSQIISVTLDADQISAAQMASLATEMRQAAVTTGFTPVTGRIVFPSVLKPGETAVVLQPGRELTPEQTQGLSASQAMNMLHGQYGSMELRSAESFATIRQFGNTEGLESDESDIEKDGDHDQGAR